MKRDPNNIAGKYILDADGNPVPCPDVYEWGRWFERAESRAERRVDITHLPGGVSVSTVFLGLDHNWGGGAPTLYETMVFNGKLDQECDRYSTKAQALAGHAAMVARVKATI